MTAAPGTDHDDLMDLASRFAYDKRLNSDDDRYDSVLVNGTTYDVLNVLHDEVTGLDAYTFRNRETQEVTVAFQGSNGTVDWQNNATLVTTATPEQFQAAQDYVANLGFEVDFVCGNSLGGGLAAYVAALDGRIEAVTVNPAPVPAALAGRDAPMVHNYLTSNDMLHQLVVAGGLSDRVIGEQIVVPGTAINDIFGANHIGSDRGVSNRGSSADGMGVYDASMGTPFSLVHDGQRVAAGSFGARVAVDVGLLRLIADGLRRQREDLGAVLRAELHVTRDDLEQYAEELPAREQAMRETVVQVAEAEYRRVHEELREVALIIERFRTLHRRVRCPRALGFFWDPVEDALLAALRGAVEGVDALLHVRIREAVEQAWESSLAAVQTSRDICEGLVRQTETLTEDLAVVDRGWSAVVLMTWAVAGELERVDADLAAAVAARRCPSDALPQLPVIAPPGSVCGVTEGVAQDLAQTVMRERAEAVSAQYAALGATLATLLVPVAAAVRDVDVRLELVEQVATRALHGVGDAVECVEDTVLTRVLHVDDDLRAFRESVEDLADEIRVRSDELQDRLRAAARAIGALPDLVLSTYPQLESLVFADDRIDLAYDSFTRVRNLVERSILAFAEARYQLEDHRATAIDALADQAERVGGDLAVIEDGLAEMVG